MTGYPEEIKQKIKSRESETAYPEKSLEPVTAYPEMETKIKRFGAFCSVNNIQGKKSGLCAAYPEQRVVQNLGSYTACQERSEKGSLEPGHRTQKKLDIWSLYQRT